MPVGRSGYIYFFIISFFYKLECKYEKKKFQSALFSPLGWWTGNYFFFKGGLRVTTPLFGNETNSERNVFPEFWANF